MVMTVEEKLEASKAWNKELLKLVSVAVNKKAVAKAAYCRVRKTMKPIDVCGDEQKDFMVEMTKESRDVVDAWEQEFIQD